MIFTLLVDDIDVVKNFVISCHQIFEEDVTSKVFVSNQKICCSLTNDNKILVSVVRTIGIPPVYLIGLIGIIINLFFWGFSWSIIFPTIFLSMGFFWSANFHLWAFKKGLKKAGYVGDFKRLKNAETLEVVLFESERFIKLV